MSLLKSPRYAPLPGWCRSGRTGSGSWPGRWRRWAFQVVSENGQQSTVSKPALFLLQSHCDYNRASETLKEMTMSTADTYVRARIDTSTSERAADALEECGYIHL